MKNKLWVKIAYILTLIIQVGIIIGTFVIEYLTNKKAGVMHHVYYRRYQFENSIFSQNNINILKIVSILLIIIFLIFMINTILKNKSKVVKIQAILTFIISIMLYISISSKYFINMLAYHYFIMTFSVVLLLQIVVYIISLINNK